MLYCTPVYWGDTQPQQYDHLYSLVSPYYNNQECPNRKGKGLVVCVRTWRQRRRIPVSWSPQWKPEDRKDRQERGEVSHVSHDRSPACYFSSHSWRRGGALTLTPWASFCSVLTFAVWAIESRLTHAGQMPCSWAKAPFLSFNFFMRLDTFTNSK